MAERQECFPIKIHNKQHSSNIFQGLLNLSGKIVFENGFAKVKIGINELLGLSCTQGKHFIG